VKKSLSPRPRGPARKAGPPAAFPALRAFCRGYLHEDFLEEHGSPEGAMRAFLAVASPVERKRLAREWRAFSGQARRAALPALRRSVSDELGAAWSPKSRAEMEAVFGLVEGPSGRPSPNP